MLRVRDNIGGAPIGEAMRDVARKRAPDQSPERKRVGPLRKRSGYEDPALALGALIRSAETVTHPNATSCPDGRLQQLAASG